MVTQPLPPLNVTSHAAELDVMVHALREGVQPALVVILAVVLALETTAFVENETQCGRSMWESRSRSRPGTPPDQGDLDWKRTTTVSGFERRLRWGLYGSLLLNVLAIIFAIVRLDVRLDAHGCLWVGIADVITYLLSISALYICLLWRAEMVSRFERSVWYRRLLVATKAFVGIAPFILCTLSVLFLGGRLVYPAPGFCILYDNSESGALILFFAVANALLSVMLLAVFLMPLVAVHNPEHSPRADDVIRVARLNAGLTAASIFVTTFATAWYTNTVRHIGEEGNPDAYLGITVDFVFAVDVVSNVVTPRLMTSLWLPSPMRRWLRRHRRAHRVSQSSSRSRKELSTQKNTLVSAGGHDGSARLAHQPQGMSGRGDDAFAAATLTPSVTESAS